jgi:hypothetical protein
VFAVVSYAEKDVPATITIDPKTLGFPAGCRVVDAETGEELQVKDNTVVFNLKKHDVRVCMVSGS